MHGRQELKLIKVLKDRSVELYNFTRVVKNITWHPVQFWCANIAIDTIDRIQNNRNPSETWVKLYQRLLHDYARPKSASLLAFDKLLGLDGLPD